MRRAWFALPTILLACWGCSGPESALPPAYRSLPVPEEQLRSAEARARGRALFAEHCALCHGVRADGRGARREGLSSRPRDFTDRSWRGRVTPRTVYHAIRLGVPGSAMPGWASLDERETWDLVAFLLAASESP